MTNTFMSEISTENEYLFGTLPTAEILLQAKSKPTTNADTLKKIREQTTFVIIDTNVWLDLLYWNDVHAVALARSLYEKTLTPVMSLATLEELADVIHRTKFNLSIERQKQLLKEVLDRCIWAEIAEKAPARCLDSDDVTRSLKVPPKRSLN